MTEEEQEAEMEMEAEFEQPTVEVEISTPIEISFNELCENFSEEMIVADLEEVVKQRVRSLYDNQEQIRQRIAQAQKQQQAMEGGGGGPMGGM